MKMHLTATNLRLADYRDARRMVQVHIASWKAAYGPYLHEKHLAWVSEKRELQRIKQRLKRHDPILVAEQDGNIVGFIAYAAPSEKHLQKPGTWEIESLFVHPEFMRRGLGSSLLHGMLKSSRAERVYVWVLSDPPAGSAFYRKHGFRRESATITDFEFLGERLPTARFLKICKRP